MRQICSVYDYGRLPLNSLLLPQNICEICYHRQTENFKVLLCFKSAWHKSINCSFAPNVINNDENEMASRESYTTYLCIN